MSEFFKRNSKIFVLILALVITFSIAFLFFENFSVKAQEQIRIITTSFSSDWENPEAALNQDLGQFATFEEFNTENSAYPFIVFSKQEAPPVPVPEIILPKATTTKATTTEIIPLSEIPTSTEEEILPPKEIIPPIESPEVTDGTTTTQIDSPSFLAKVWTKIKGLLGKEVKATEYLNESVFIFSDFSTSEEFQNDKIINAQLRMSLAGKGKVGEVLSIDYFYQGSWENLAEFNLKEEFSNYLNGGYFLFGLPVFEKWEDLANLKVKFTYLGQQATSDQQKEIYLDAVWLEIEYGTSESQPEEPIDEPIIEDPIIEESVVEEPIVEEPVVEEEELEEDYILELTSDRKDFKLDEKSSFKFRYQKKRNLIEKIGVSIINIFQDEYRDINIKVTLPDSDIIPIVNYLGDGEFSVDIDNPSRKFKPGKYKINIRIEDKGQVTLIQGQEFTWGVLAINTNKSIYLPGEQAYLQMAALRDNGHTICDADLFLTITGPNGKKTNPEVQVSGKCGPDNVTDVPDYFSYYKVEKEGIYQMILVNNDTGHKITDSFEVRGSVPFEIERMGPTRIWPWADYEITLKIKVNQDFIGQVIERVPVDFEIIATSDKQEEINGEEKLIIWDFVDWKTDEIYKLKYTFDAPDISPYLYLLGPLQVGNFQEIRQWQIASDAYTNLGGGDHDGADWTISANTNIAGYHFNIGTFTVNNAIVATVEPWDGTSYGSTTISATTINVIGTIDASKAGYRGGTQGDGTNPASPPWGEGTGGYAQDGGGEGSDGATASNGAGGGAYGGDGGDGGDGTDSTPGGGKLGGNSYGATTTETINMGSGAGGHDAIGGRGGGAISLIASGNITISGMVTSTGEGGDEPAGVQYAAAGGGAGGGILIKSTGGSVTVTGTLSVDGGQGGLDNSTDNAGPAGGGGGGGRIKIFYTIGCSTSSATITAAGGVIGLGTGVSEPGATGTIYYLQLNSPPDTPTLADTPAFSNMLASTTTPILGGFSSTDDDTDDVEFWVEWDTDYDFGSPATTTTATTTSGATTTYTIGSALSEDTVYWWRVKVRDPEGTNVWSSYSSERSISASSTLDVSQWFQTTGAQFNTDDLTDTATTATSVKLIGW